MQPKVAPAPINVCHRPGRHCGSSAVRDLLEFHGQPMSEAMCFGLGAGLGVTYVNTGLDTLPHIVHVRAMEFESKVFERLGVPFQWQTFTAPQQADARLNARLADSKPCLLLTNIRYLPYFNTDTDFPGHAIIAWDRDLQNGDVLVTDTEREALLPVPEAALSQARFSIAPPFIHPGNLFSPDCIEPTVDRAQAIRQAILDNAQRLYHSRDDGLSALLHWREQVASWCAHKDASWLLRFAYQVIEKRGTGGGGFRKMYAEFLQEAAELLPEVEEKQLVPKMAFAAECWTKLAYAFKAQSEQLEADSSVLSQAIAMVHDAEQHYLATVLDI